MSVPYGAVSSNHTSRWHPEPTFRGTASILSSCIITMGFCVWTAVHLNIPEHGQKGFFTPQFRRKIKWLLIGLFAPEVIAGVAFEQRREAMRIHKKMRRILKQVDEPHFLRRWLCMSRFKRMLWKEKDSTKRKLFDDRHEWTMAHSHFVAMGGFAVDVSKIEFIAPKRYTQFTLMTDGFLWVADWALEHIPNISEAEIRDKSKADGLAKTLVCIQATWFCVQ
ncbi:hypothetical protein BCR34DRAFT_167146 [Clohesyomyces aquaticus]|uniref:Uncharacterized protein n=1 Tax=Clohesyomyces aquaticus TaxID=1231657 RepID=A0A1Y1YH70_9PLEO|nr:hypothetical protein BCR34DRAFT_167146 [Clohesyomyces aquaticus]